MGRNIKEGLSFFPLDVDIFEDEKIQFVSARFGLKGEAITIRLLCKIFRQGYFIKFDDDVALLFARSVGDTNSHGLVKDVVNELLKRAFFERNIFERFGVLTSKGIQRRYLKICKDAKRINFEIEPKTDLINGKNLFTTEETNIIPEFSTQRKEKKRIVNKSKEEEEVKSFRFSPPTQDEVYNYFLEKKLNEPIAKLESEKFINFYDSKGWVIGKTKMQKWKSAASGWINRMNDFNNNQNKSYGQKNKSNNTDFTTNR